MKNYDVILIHPPAVYDFRKKPLFAGALGSSVEAVQFAKVPIGMLSLAEYLDRHQYKVILDNLGDRMASDPAFDVEKHLKGMSSRIYAVGLHFQQHAQGALEIARLLKKFHPTSLVVMGGLTATRFAGEILSKWGVVDAVIRGATEKSFVEMLRGLEKNGRLGDTPGLTYRSEANEIKSTPLMPHSPDLDLFDYTRFDLLEPKTSVFPVDGHARWSLEVCRGCTYNCAICGGSAYAYKTYLGMDKPAFRSPVKIIEDIHKLTEQGIRFIGLYQDPRMGGKKYTQDLLSALHKDSPDIARLSLDLLAPVDEEFIQEVSRIGKFMTVHICPDTGSDAVRQKLGRHYTTEELLNTINLCHKYFIPVTSFFSVGLAGETREEVEQTWELWDQISNLEQIATTRGNEWSLRQGALLGGPIMGPILLDPGSLAFDYPEKYGYKLLYKNLEEYVNALSQPSWHQWLNYETDLLNKDDIVRLIFETQSYTIDKHEEYRFYGGRQAERERRKLQGDIIAANEVNRIMRLPEYERPAALESLKTKYEEFLREGERKPRK